MILQSILLFPVSAGTYLQPSDDMLSIRRYLRARVLILLSTQSFQLFQ